MHSFQRQIAVCAFVCQWISQQVLPWLCWSAERERGGILDCAAGTVAFQKGRFPKVHINQSWHLKCTWHHNFSSTNSWLHWTDLRHVFFFVGTFFSLLIYSNNRFYFMTLFFSHFISFTSVWHRRLVFTAPSVPTGSASTAWTTGVTTSTSCTSQAQSEPQTRRWRLAPHSPQDGVRGEEQHQLLCRQWKPTLETRQDDGGRLPPRQLFR